MIFGMYDGAGNFDCLLLCLILLVFVLGVT